ncbi:1-acyl-sn-glycerol-3-phosphate acyltransferase [Endozoicomonas sp. SM1973]|uniref:1-acyl-sn-glycerol-3-phosphate acyltransferase n=1 Tax=Spartinivicinus marinus TaxID=2994442 RepID=A0A853IM25_9GAMM|nr:lysophospholipid acyltransferase family protein [Spartinivicinus marinus]MCX4025904.1 lysophospholipid acyltransferase family protein [Spartinivicinus marinus]NYZ68826.1 1-acyl-sn-glycerol-3-phosphate acyltransferase [Spartinivicinus marinus]
MKNWLKILFFALLVRPIVFFIIGLNVHHKKNLPDEGSAILAANHNSHLDTLVLMSLFPLTQLYRLRPVAAADYFMKNRWVRWFSLRVLNIIPLHRDGSIPKESILSECHQALADGDILILFPEGSRGKPEQLGEFKKGIFHLANAHPTAKVIPVFTYGLGKSLPKGEKLLVPFFSDVVIGSPLDQHDDSQTFMTALNQQMQQLSKQVNTGRILD